MINGGTFDKIVEQTAALGVDTTGLLAVKDSLLHTDSVMFLLAGYERILTTVAVASIFAIRKIQKEWCKKEKRLLT